MVAGRAGSCRRAVVTDHRFRQRIDCQPQSRDEIEDSAAHQRPANECGVDIARASSRSLR